MSGYHYEQERPSFGFGRITWAVQRLILANILFFAAQLLVDIPMGGRISLIGGDFVQRWLALETYRFLHGAIWQAITYQFLHADLMHLFVNMLTLFFFGPEVERRLGTPQFYRFYLFCGAIGAVATALWAVGPGGHSVVVGASGSALGVRSTCGRSLRTANCSTCSSSASISRWMR